jgi:D-serine deaminase-like pyridoxal phosphate-dependent protein
MTYDNARLPEALIRAGIALEVPRYTETGLRALRFYEDVTIESGIFVPIGNEGWYQRGRLRARYVQQPLEAVAMVDAELAAFDATQDAAHLSTAELALEWYYGKNSRGVLMAHGGGCYDGLSENGVNHNQGAESTLAFLAAAYAMAQRRTRVLRAVR